MDKSEIYNSIYKIEKIVERHIPKPELDAKCHSGICTRNECARCKDAWDIRYYIELIKSTLAYT